MPPLPDPPGPTIRFDLNWKVGGDIGAMTRLFFTFSGGRPSPTNMDGLCGSVQGSADSNFPSVMSSAVTLESVTGADITDHTGSEGAEGTPTVGTRTGTPVGAGTAVVVSHTIGQRYRGGKPRSYLPFGVAEDLASSLLWASAFVGEVDAAWGGFLIALPGIVNGTTTLETYIALSYYSGVNPPVTLPSGRVKQSAKVRAVPLRYDITGHITRATVGSQRRRNRNA